MREKLTLCFVCELHVLSSHGNTLTKFFLLFNSLLNDNFSQQNNIVFDKLNETFIHLLTIYK